MMEKTTKNGIYFDISQSPYAYSVNQLVFYFTSKKHMHKFINQIDEQIERVNQSLSHRFHVSIRTDEIAALQLYKRIEPNAFFIYDIFYDKCHTSPGTLKFQCIEVK